MTVTVHVAVSSPTVAVIVVVPSLIAVTRPVEFTVAMVSSLLVQLIVAPSSVPVQVKVSVFPSSNSKVVLDKDSVAAFTIVANPNIITKLIINKRIIFFDFCFIFIPPKFLYIKDLLI